MQLAAIRALALSTFGILGFSACDQPKATPPDGKNERAKENPAPVRPVNAAEPLKMPEEVRISESPRSKNLDPATAKTNAVNSEAAAEFDLGTLYAGGSETVPRDPVAAAKWYRSSAEKGFAAAQSALGHMYENGNGVPKNDSEAARWYGMAADQGNKAALVSLATMHKTGRGVPKDLVRADMYFTLAGVTSAKTQLESGMTREQIAEAQRMAAEWKPSKSQK